MRSSSFARVVMAGLGISVVITLGCGESPGEPSGPFSVLSISPAEGTSAGNTPVVIRGTGFVRGQAGATVTVDGSPVKASPAPDGTIRFVMPAHAVGTVDVTVIAPLGQAQASVPGGYTYVPLPPPVVTEVRPIIGSTSGGLQMIIIGTGFQYGLTVTVGGIVTPFDYDDFGVDVLYLLTPAHAAGTVEVIVTNPDGRTGSGTFTYASPATFDFNGDWQGFAGNLAVVLTIRDNTVVSVSCGASILTLDPPAVVANGEFSFAGSDGVSISGQILSPDWATGSINMGSCVGRLWFSKKK
jgi:hypothetical protein